MGPILLAVAVLVPGALSVRRDHLHGVQHIDSDESTFAGDHGTTAASKRESVGLWISLTPAKEPTTTTTAAPDAWGWGGLAGLIPQDLAFGVVKAAAGPAIQTSLTSYGVQSEVEVSEESSSEKLEARVIVKGVNADSFLEENAQTIVDTIVDTLLVEYPDQRTLAQTLDAEGLKGSEVVATPTGPRSFHLEVTAIKARIVKAKAGVFTKLVRSMGLFGSRSDEISLTAAKSLEVEMANELLNNGIEANVTGEVGEKSGTRNADGHKIVHFTADVEVLGINATAFEQKQLGVIRDAVFDKLQENAPSLFEQISFPGVVQSCKCGWPGPWPETDAHPSCSTSCFA